MGETLTERRRVDEEGRKVVKSFCRRRIRLGVERRTDDVSLRISPGQLRASSRGNTYGASVVRNHWAQRACRRFEKPGVKGVGLTDRLRWELPDWSHGGGAGIPGVGVKSVEIWKNTGGEGELLAND